MSERKSLKSNKSNSRNFYESIDELPIHNFWKLTEGFYDYLFKDEARKTESEVLEKQWIKLYDEYLDAFGVSYEFKAICAKEKRIALMKIKMILENKPSLKTAITVEEKILEKLKGDSRQGEPHDELSNERQVISIEAYFKISVDPRNTSTKKFFTYVKIIREENV